MLPHPFPLFWDWTGVGIFFLLTLTGALVLILAGRLGGLETRALGLGRHVEALLLVSFVATFLSNLGIISGGTFGQVPIHVGDGGVVAVSLVGAIVPVILSVHFLLRTGSARAALVLLAIAITSAASYFTSEPVEGLGIVSFAPLVYLPTLIAAGAGLLIAQTRWASLPIAYACGSLGALIGADLLRVDWVLNAPVTAASFGGANSQDLVFLQGLWAVALASVAHLPKLFQLRRASPEWERIARLTRDGAFQAALEAALRLVTKRLETWARDRGLQGAPREQVWRVSTARPVLEQASTLIARNNYSRAAVRPVLENLEGLDRRLARPGFDHPAPRGRRFAAGAIDLVPVFAVAIVAAMLASTLDLAPTEDETPAETQARSVLARLILVVWSAVTAHVLFGFLEEWATGGFTLGKWILGLRVVRQDGGRPSGWDCLVRNIGRILDAALFYLVAFASTHEQGRQRLGDYFASTYVQDARARARMSTLMAAPKAMPVHARPGIARESLTPR